MKKLLLLLLLLPLIQAQSISFIYPEDWARGSEITLTIQSFNESNQYAPKNITFNQESNGIYLNEIKYLDSQTRLILLLIIIIALIADSKTDK